MKPKFLSMVTVTAALVVGAFVAPLARAVTVYTNPSASGSAFCGGGSTENLGFVGVLPGNAVTGFTFGSAGSQFGGGVASFAIFSDPSYSNLIQMGSLGGFNFGYPSGGVANYAVFVSGFLPSGYWQVSIGAFCSPAASTAGYNGLTIDQELPPPGMISLGQFIADGTTPIAGGGVTTGTTVVFGASIQSSTSTDPLQFQVEVQPSANGFSGNPTAVASSSEGKSVAATVSGLQDGSYHWTARIYDPVTHAATPWQAFSSSTTDFVVADALVATSSTVLTDSTTIYSAGNGFVGGCCPNTVMSPGPVFYHAPTPFTIQSILVDDNDFSSNNHDGVGNIRASIYDLHGNLIARSLNTLYGESGCTGCGFAFSGEAVPQDFQVSLVVEDGIQGDSGFTVRNLRFFVAPQTGTIVVSTNNAGATFAITDGSGHTFSGSGTSFTQTVAPGAYTINYGSVIGLTAPPTATASLGAGGTITFKGIYICEPPPGRAAFLLQIIPDTPGFDSCPPKDFSGCRPLDASGNCLMKAVGDDQGNQFQLWCMKPTLPNHIFSWYGLFYLPVGGTAKFAGKCPYEGGQDQGIIYYSAPTALSQPSCFVRSRWQVVDGGFFDDELLYVPWVGCPACKPYSWVYDFDVASRMTTSTHINPSGIPIGTSMIDPLPDFNNLPPVLDLSAIPFGGAPMGLTEPGDVNVDGQVDCRDVKIVRGALGTKNGDFGFAPGADINRDGVVDINDLAMVIQNFTVPSTTCPNLITVQTFLDDVENSVQLGLIDNQGIANSLVQKIRAASDAAMSGQAKTATNILNAFSSEVQAQTNKHILPAAGAVLSSDAASLISQINQQSN